MAAAIGIAKTATEIFLGVGEVSIDNLTFQLHYRWTVTLFIVASVLVQTSQFFGDPVQCETAEDSVDDDVLNSFCWMYSSFDMPTTFTGPCTRKKLDPTGTYLYNTYYQWVPIFLAVQAALFYIPRCIWLMLEGGLMAYMVKGKCTKIGLLPQCVSILSYLITVYLLIQIKMSQSIDMLNIQIDTHCMKITQNVTFEFFNFNIFR